MERRYFLDDYDLDELPSKTKLESIIKSAREREEALEHVLLYGTSGCKELAGVIANELGVNIRLVSARDIPGPGDLGALLTNLQVDDVLYIENIHQLHPQVEEVLYPAMEDYTLDIMIGKGPTARTVHLDLAPFTFIGSAPSSKLLSQTFRSLFETRINVIDHDHEQNVFLQEFFSNLKDLRYKVSDIQDDVGTIKYSVETIEDDVREIKLDLKYENQYDAGTHLENESAEDHDYENENTNDDTTKRWIESLVPILDNFERALRTQVVSEEAQSFVKGMGIIYRQIKDLIEEKGVREIEAEGEPFDPHIHDAIDQVKDQDYPSNTVVEVVQKGYKLGDDIIRPAMVKVAK